MAWKFQKLQATKQYFLGKIPEQRGNSKFYEISTTIAILGEVKSGKTSLAKRISQKSFPDSFDNLTESYDVDLSLNSKRVICKHELSIHDTPGNVRDRFPYIYESIIHNNDTFILIFSLSSSKGISMVTRTLNDVKNIKGEQVPVLVVANKSDIESKTEEDIKKRFRFYRDLATMNIPSVEVTCMCQKELDYRKYLIPLLQDIEERHDIKRGKDINITIE